MAGWVEDAMKAGQGDATVSKSKDQACVDKANASSQVMAIDNVINGLVKNWHPTGYYRPSEVQTLLDTLDDQAAAAGAALAAAPLSTAMATEIKADAFKEVARKYGDQGQAYRRAIAEAKAKGSNVIDAPGLKDWVVRSMRSISDAYVTATVLECMQTWVSKWLDRAYNAMADIGRVAARILGVAGDLAINVVKAAEATVGIAGAIIRYAPYAALGLGAYLLYNYVKKQT
jgi:hypothetical protein